MKSSGTVFEEIMMNNPFGPDSKFIHYANKFSELVTLNLWLVVTCLPVFTIGAAVTAMHVVLLKIYRDELEQGVTKSFFLAFKNNFRKSSVIWCIYVVLLLVLSADIYMIYANIFAGIPLVNVLVIIVAVILLFSLNWVFVLQSRYENTVIVTIRNAAIFGFIHFFDTVLMFAVLVVPIVLLLWKPSTVPFILICGFSLSGIIRTAFYNRIFIKYEENINNGK